MGVDRRFQAKLAKILKLAYYGNYCIDLNQILHSDKDNQTFFVDGPITRITNLRWRTPAILEKGKSSYIHSGLIDRREIWQGDANWPSPPYRPLKIRSFKNQRWRMADLNIAKPRYLGNGISDRRDI